MSDSLNFRLRLSADGSAFVGQVRIAREELDRLKRTTDEADRGSAQMGASMTRAAAFGAAAGTVIADAAIEAARAMVQMFTETVRVGEAFSNLSASTGSSVEAMSRQANAAAIGGASFEQYEGVLLKVARSLNGVDQESTKAQKALSFLGISTKDPAEALQQLAARLDDYADGAGKVAIVNDILGRDGARMILMLKDIAREQGAAATITADQARASESLAREWRRLGQEGDAWATSLMPALTDFLEQLREGIKIAGGFWRALQLFGTMNPFKNTAENLRDVRAQLEAAQKPGKEYDPVTRKYIDAPPDQEQIRRLKEQLEYLKLLQRQEINARLGGETFDDQVSRRAVKRDLPYAPDKKAKDEVDEYTKLVDKLNQELAATDAQLRATFSGEQLVPAEKRLAEFMASADWKKLTEPQQVEYRAKYDELIAAQKAVRDLGDAQKDAGKAAAEYAKGVAEWTEAQERAYQSVLGAADDFIAQLELETRTMGMTSAERQRYIVLTQLQAQMEQRAGESAEDYAARLDVLREKIASINQAFDSNKSAQALQESLARQKEYWAAAYADVANTITDAVIGAFGDIKNAGQYLKRALDQLFQNWVIRPIVQASVQGVSGGMAGMFTNLQGGMGGFGGGGGGGFDPLSLFGMGGGAGLGTSLMGAAGSFATSGLGAGLGLSSTVFELGGASSMALTGAGAGLVGLAGTIGTMIPYIGAALAIASALGVFDKEPSEVQGKFNIAAGTGGFEDGAFTRSRFGNLGFADDGTKYFSGDAAQVFNQMIAGALDAVATRLTDEQIAAVSTKLQDIDFGGEEGTYTTQDFIEKYGATILKQVVAAAMEELNPAMAALVAGFNGTADETVAFANALLQLHDALSADPVAEADEAWTSATRSIVDALAAQRDEVMRLSAEYDGSAASTTALSNATMAYKNAVVQTLVAIKQVAAQLNSQADDAREHLMTQGLSQQALYDYYKGKGDTLVTGLDAATTPEQVNALGAQAMQYLIRSFDLMPEGDQNAQRETFLANLSKLQDLINAKLADITAGVTDGTEDPFKAVQDALGRAADTIGSAANTFDGGAKTIGNAAGSIANAVEKFGGAVGKFATTRLAVDVTVNGPAQVGGQV